MSRSCRGLIQGGPLVVAALFGATLLHAEQGILLVNVRDTSNRPISLIQLGLGGDGGSAVTDSNGRARIQLPPSARPGQPVELRLLGRAAVEWAIVIPYQGREHIPLFDGSFGSQIDMTIGRPGDTSQLTSQFWSTLMPRQRSDAAPSAAPGAQQRSLVSEVAASLRLPPQQVETAFRSFLMNVPERDRVLRETPQALDRIFEQLRIMQEHSEADRRSLTQRAEGTSDAERDALKAEKLRLERENLELRETLESLKAQVRNRAEYRGDFERLVKNADAEHSALVTVLNPPAAAKTPWQLGAVTYVNPDQELMGIGAMVFGYVSARQNRAIDIPELKTFHYKEWYVGGDVAAVPRAGIYVGRMASGGPVSLRVDEGGLLRSFRSALKSGGRGLVIDLGTLASFPCRFQDGYVVTYLGNTAQPGVVVLVLKGASTEKIVGWLLTRKNPKDQITLVEFEAIPQGVAWPSN